MNTSLLAVFDSIENFFATIADALQFDILMWVFLGIFVLLIVMTLIRLRFTYEVRAIKSFKKINKYFLKKPYINESNLVEFNRLMKKIPYQLRDRWQFYMLNREGLPSGEMTLYHCVEQPIKTSNYRSTIVMLKYVVNICTVLCVILSLFAVGNSVLTPLTLVRGLIVPAMFYVLCQLYIYFLNAKFNANSIDLYEYYLSFIRNLDKASASIPDYVDYELLFTDKEIRDGIPVLREYLEKRALLDKLAREKAKQNESERENFDFTSLGIDGSLLVERAMTTSQDYLNNRNRLKEEITKLETQKDNYNEQYVAVEKDNQKKLQAIKENLARLQSQLESSANRIETNYIKKQQDQEKGKQAEIEKNLEDLHIKYAQQMKFLEEEISKRQAEIEEDKKKVSEQMDAEFQTYNEKVYTILRNKIDQDDADGLKVTRAELDNTRDKLSAETQEKENLELTLDIKQQQIDTMQSTIDALNDKIAKLTSRDKRNIAAMYDENIELKKQLAELQQSAQPQQENEETVYYDKDGNVVDFSQYYDENGYFKEFPKVYDKDGNYYDFADYYDKYGNPLTTEESGENAEASEQPAQEVANTETAEQGASEESNENATENAQDEEPVYYDKDGNVVDFSQYYDENGYFKEFPKVYDKDGNYYDFADYYDKYGNPLTTEENGESVQEEQPAQDEANAEQIANQENAENVENNENVENTENGENAEKPVEVASEENNENANENADASEQDDDVVYYDKDGNVVDFSQYYDENGKFKEFPKVYDKDGNYYAFADYYDENGNLLSQYADAENQEEQPAQEQNASETPESETLANENGENVENAVAVADNDAMQENAVAQEQPLESNSHELVLVNTQPNELVVQPMENAEQPKEEVVEQPKRKRGRPKKVQTEQVVDGQPAENKENVENKETAEKEKKPATKKSSSKKQGEGDSKKSATGTKKKSTGAKKNAGSKTKKVEDEQNKVDEKPADEKASKKSTTKKASSEDKPKAKSTTKKATKPSTKKSTKGTTKKSTPKEKKADEDLDKISGQIDSENAKLEQKQADLKNKITQTLSELQETPTVDRDLEEIKDIIKKLKDQAAEVNKGGNGLTEKEQKDINKQINKSLSELLMIMANKSKK